MIIQIIKFTHVHVHYCYKVVDIVFWTQLHMFVVNAILPRLEANKNRLEHSVKAISSLVSESESSPLWLSSVQILHCSEHWYAWRETANTFLLTSCIETCFSSSCFEQICNRRLHRCKLHLSPPQDQAASRSRTPSNFANYNCSFELCTGRHVLQKWIQSSITILSGMTRNPARKLQ